MKKIVLKCKCNLTVKPHCIIKKNILYSLLTLHSFCFWWSCSVFINQKDFQYHLGVSIDLVFSFNWTSSDIKAHVLKSQSTWLIVLIRKKNLKLHQKAKCLIFNFILFVRGQKWVWISWWFIQHYVLKPLFFGSIHEFWMSSPSNIILLC